MTVAASNREHRLKRGCSSGRCSVTADDGNRQVCWFVDGYRVRPLGRSAREDVGKCHEQELPPRSTLGKQGPLFGPSDGATAMGSPVVG
ncbi:hypothetical protein NL676_008922 [Syzygium grande]|nr:hypothetical protein NL676_008922 [Syzygium grande]